jgi:formylglycine-generating enzyme required for sulfatase activity
VPAFRPPGGRGRALFAGVATLALALGSAAALRARTASGAALPPGGADTGDARPATPAPALAEAPASPASPEVEPAPREDEDVEPQTLEEQRRRLFARMEDALGIDDEAMERVAAIFAASPVLGQGNPAISRHPMTRSECRRIRAEAGLEPARVAACGAPNMVPIFDAEAGDTAVDAPVCVDQFEFPDIPCEYPVVNVRASEAAQLCEAVGKRLCDAHEWEGACAGSLRPPDAEYAWGWPRLQATYAHNVLRERVWAYGPKKDHALCATGSVISPGCTGGGWTKCGSNTYPAGAFPACQSSFGVFDQHGNAAEHMSLPTVPEELASREGEGFTEMKGSWFVFSTIQAHEDDCRFRAPSWHETRVSNPQSHRNYHLGFRCCKDVEAR